MKNVNAKHALYLVLAVVSIYCTIYLNTQQPKKRKKGTMLRNSEYVEADELEQENNSSDALFLDVSIIQKAFETGKKFIPVRQ